MLASHRIVHLMMTLNAEAVRTRVNSGASPHHRIVFAKAEITAAPAGTRRPRPRRDGPGTRSAWRDKEGSLVAHHRFVSRTPKTIR